jgi:hypothetical protein
MLFFEENAPVSTPKMVQFFVSFSVQPFAYNRASGRHRPGPAADFGFGRSH